MKLSGWLFILSSLTLGFFTFSRSADKIASISWPFTYGTVLSSDIYQRAGRSTDWCVRLRYRYSVDGRIYVSNRLSTSLAGNAGCDRTKALITAQLQKIQPGNHIKVRYDPISPKIGIIYTDGLDVLDYFFACLVLVLLAGGLWQVMRQSA
ncbi:DUF3592 domain-containing protein [Pseudoduganella sp. SL102]|uniref:DUF3592 domain-containing protein n=1 Tax=Pseudoduganella sp. SL102 TaxID=2995154 RepID=UPI00248B9C0C|nr:DUF3592 domain-containing protein [Pseudoduganella sp. SL102]WBS00569.1 DUF3592 domain-containing protein [Pseudoduganella sp. SL102]